MGQRKVPMRLGEHLWGTFLVRLYFWAGQADQLLLKGRGKKDEHRIASAG